MCIIKFIYRVVLNPDASTKTDEISFRRCVNDYIDTIIMIIIHIDNTVNDPQDTI